MRTGVKRNKTGAHSPLRPLTEPSPTYETCSMAAQLSGLVHSSGLALSPRGRLAVSVLTAPFRLGAAHTVPFPASDSFSAQAGPTDTDLQHLGQEGARVNDPAQAYLSSC